MSDTPSPGKGTERREGRKQQIPVKKARTQTKVIDIEPASGLGDSASAPSRKGAKSRPIPNKIINFADISREIEGARLQGKTIVHCHGVFDLLHIGHIRHFKQAKNLGDVLIVTLTADKWVNKGFHRPAFTETLRAEAIAALEFVDFVAINHSSNAVPAIEQVRPNVYVKGGDYRDCVDDARTQLEREKRTVEKEGGKLVFTDDVQFSSSTLLNKHLSAFPPEISRYLEEFRQQHSLETVLSQLSEIRNLRVLVVGEAIIDDYHYVEAIGKAGKEPVLVTRSKSREQFAGGGLAVANHVAGFCSDVALLSCLGTVNSHREFIGEKLKPNISAGFVTLENRPTIVKLRYMDHCLLQKLFEVYFIEDQQLNVREEDELLFKLEKLLPHYDVVITTDYGHGMLGRRAVELISEKAKFLAVNTQANAGNRGLNSVCRYPRADYISMSETELQLEMRVREGDVNHLLEQLMAQANCPLFTITQGRKGLLCHRRGFGTKEAPGFAEGFVDRVGSGDAVLSITTPFAALGADLEILCLIGNLAGCQAVKTVGHRTSLEFEGFRRLLTSLLK